MRRLRSLTLAILLLGAGFGCSRSSDDPVSIGGRDYDEREMEAAIARARSTVDTFLAELQSPTGTDHSVKVPITDSNGTEHFWLTDITYQDGFFTGKIGNEPQIVKNVRPGQTWRVKKKQISDWMFIRDGKIYGNYTLRPILKRLPPEEATRWYALLAEP